MCQSFPRTSRGTPLAEPCHLPEFTLSHAEVAPGAEWVWPWGTGQGWVGRAPAELCTHRLSPRLTTQTPTVPDHPSSPDPSLLRTQAVSLGVLWSLSGASRPRW